MSIEIDKIKINAKKKTIVDTLNSLSQKLNSNLLKDIYYDLNRSVGIDDSDLNFILDFLEKLRYVRIAENKLYVEKEIIAEEVFNVFKEYYLNTILLDKNLRKNLFNFSEFKVIDNNLCIDINQVDLDYRPVFIFLERLEIVKSLNSNHKIKIVQNTIVAQLIYEKSLKKISKKDFDKIQKRKIEKGNLAEEFVLKEEQRKLKNSTFNPERVSEVYVNLGYDILSYDREGNKIYIEVKTLAGGNHIFWTKNEIKTAKIYQDAYKIYCILFDNDGYPKKVSKIISNPYDRIILQKLFKKEPTGDFIVYID